MSLRCLIGRHDWEPLRYWEVDGAPEVETLVEGPVCRRCRTCSRKGRRVIQRVYPDAARRWAEGERTASIASSDHQHTPNEPGLGRHA